MKNRTMLRFPGFLNKAVTLSYDDGVRQDKKLIKTFVLCILTGLAALLLVALPFTAKKGVFYIFEMIKSEMSVTSLAKSDVEYALKPKRNCSKKVIDYEKFDFFHNSVLPKNGIKVKIKSLCLKNKYVRKLRLKIKRQA